MEKPFHAKRPPAAVSAPRSATRGQLCGSNARQPPRPCVRPSTGSSANAATVKAIWKTEKRSLASLMIASAVEKLA
jgi:hypothetical protein